MKLARNLFFGLAMLGMIVFLAKVSFAQTTPSAENDRLELRKKHMVNVKVLMDSAAALQQINPDLAKRMRGVAHDEMMMRPEGMPGGPGRMEPPVNSPMWRARHEVKSQLYQEAAAALQKSNPDLAKSLQSMSAEQQKIEIETQPLEKNK